MAKIRKKFVTALDYCEAILVLAKMQASSGEDYREIEAHKDSIHQLKNIVKQSIKEPSFNFEKVIRAQG